MTDDADVQTGIAEPPPDWSGRHLADHELTWFDFDPARLAEFVRRYGADYPELPERLLECRRAAWACGSHVRFAAHRRRSAPVETTVVSNEEHSSEFQEYGIDIDRDGHIVGVELLHRECLDR